MAHFAKLALVSLGALALVGCDSAAENEVEQQAEAIDEQYEADAKATEAFAEGGTVAEEKAADAKADALRKEGEQTKDHLEDMADEMDKSPQ